MYKKAHEKACRPLLPQSAATNGLFFGVCPDISLRKPRSGRGKVSFRAEKTAECGLMISVRHSLKAMLRPAEDHNLASWLFLRLLAIVYFAAFLSLAGQISGLAGPAGILPFGQFLDHAWQRLGISAWFYFPTVFWLNSSDLALLAGVVLGCGFSLTLFLDLWPRLSLVLLFLLYLSLSKAGQIFLNFQWDYLLLESGFLAIFLVGGPTRLIIFMFHWLLFRLRFMSGFAKLASGDPSWSGFTALNSYFETQPLPHVGAWYAHQLPETLLQAGVALTLFAELVVPFFIFLPRAFRLTAAWVTILMQLLIIATSNHNFINLLTLLLCLFLLDDGIVRRILPESLHRRSRVTGNAPQSHAKAVFSVAAAALILSSSLPLLIGMTSNVQIPARLNQWTQLVRQFGIGNAYHVFPTMQTERIELQIEGSDDGADWQVYAFPWKPGALEKRPAFIVPHQPRLDWMMWFVPTQQPDMLYWFDLFMRRLWEGSPQVTALLAHNPFTAQPPRYLRVTAYRYRFTTPAERKQTGNWWKREYLGLFPQISPRQP